MALHNQSSFAKLTGVSKVAISKAVKNGKLTLNENKKIDDKDSLSLVYINAQIKRNTTELKREKTIKKSDKSVKSKVKPEKIPENNTEKNENQTDNNNDNKALAFTDVSQIKITSITDAVQVVEYQEIFKAVKLQEEALTKQLQRKEKEKSLIDVEMGKFLFHGFIDQLKIELAILPAKEDPNLESLYKNNQNIKAQELLKRNFQMILEQIVNDQGKALAKWKRDK
jgi:hypothetical protein